jgi:hypothetical protein
MFAIRRAHNVTGDENDQELLKRVFLPVRRTAGQRLVVMTDLDAEESQRFWTFTHSEFDNRPPETRSWCIDGASSPEPALEIDDTTNSNNAAIDNLTNAGAGQEAHGQGDGWAAETGEDANGWATHQDDVGDDGWGGAATGSVIVCTACSDQVTGAKAIFISCGHPWHRDCLNDNFHNALTSRINWPAGYCDQIDHNAVQQYLDENVLMTLFDRAEKYDSPNPVFCSNFACSNFNSDTIVNASKTHFATCPLCKHNTCKDSKASTRQHPVPALCPMYLSNENEELAKKEGWKQCPHPVCHSWIERTEGCNTMECAACKTEFCYRLSQLLILYYSHPFVGI